MRHRRMGCWLGAASVAVSVLLAVPDTPAEAQTLRCPGSGAPVVDGSRLPPGTGEASGLVASTRYPGWGWMIRDSGNPAALYAVRFPGGAGPHEVRTIRVRGAVNIDWEDIASQDGKLYVVESDQSRRARVIYEIPEPDPLGPSQVTASARYRYAYPGGRRYNTETAFVFAGRLVLVPKTTPALLYRFDGPLSPIRINRPRLVGALAGSNTVSLAKVAPDGTTLVVANHQELFVYRTPVPAAALRDFTTRPVDRQRIAAGANVEGGAYFPLGQCKLVLFGENRDVYRVFPLPPPNASSKPTPPARVSPATRAPTPPGRARSRRRP